MEDRPYTFRPVPNGLAWSAVAALVLLVSSSPPALGLGEVLPPSIDGYWVENAADLEPPGLFTWRTLSFRSPDEGWIAGDSYLLHVLDGGERIEVTFLYSSRRDHVSFNSIQAYGPGSLIAGGSGQPRNASRLWDPTYGVVYMLKDGRWSAQSLTDIPVYYWNIRKLRSDPNGLSWALLAIANPEDYAPIGGFVLRGEDGQWRLDRSLDHFGHWVIEDMCLDTRGDWWFVGSDNLDPARENALGLRMRAGQVERVALPPSLSTPSWLGAIECLPNGSLLASGVQGTARPGSRPEGRLIRYDPRDSAWHDVAFPENMRWFRPAVLAAVSGTEAWMTAQDDTERERRPAVFLHWREGEWEVVPMPAIPHRRQQIVIEDMTFVSPGEGWAVGNHNRSEGVIFRYKHGQWRYRAWNWSFWDNMGTFLFRD